ncbi:MAG: hypothetical protein ABFS17_08020 [Chloroflexota bacterium]
MKRNWKILTFTAVLFFVAAACTVDLAEWKFWESEEPAPSLATFTPIPTQPSTSPDVAQPTAVPPTAVPVTPQQPSGPNTTAVGADCLPGVWQINHPSVVKYINDTMFGVQQYGFTPQSSEGKLELQIVPGNIFLKAEEFTVAVGVNVGDMANISAFSAAIDSDASANYTATDSQVALTDILYTAEGSITSLTATFTIDFYNLLNLAQSMGFAKDLPNPVTSQNMEYTCSGDQLTIVVNPFAFVTFDRVVE